jgi:hypothetical protein
MLRAVGMGDEDWVKPQIGIASSWNEITPCNMSLDRLAKASKEGVFAAGGFPMQFGTISVSDGISMGHEGMHFSLVSREIIADSVETVMNDSRIKSGGYWHLATDWQEYAEQMMEVLSAEPTLINTGSLPGGYAERPTYRPVTKFENRGIRLGHGVWDLVFKKA